MEYNYAEDLERQVIISKNQEHMMFIMYETLKAVATLTPSRMDEEKTQAFLEASDHLQKLNLRLKSLSN